jgi:dTDP-4-dehydrorhamnose 3,5-epimerase
MKGVTITKIEPVYVDGRGAITDLLNKPLGHVGLITSAKKSIRGNHYHKKSIQYNFILSGKFEVLVADYKNPEKTEKIILKIGDLITIQPKIVHTFKALETGSFLDMISQSRAGDKYEEDVVKGVILK